MYFKQIHYRQKGLNPSGLHNRKNTPIFLFYSILTLNLHSDSNNAHRKPSQHYPMQRDWSNITSKVIRHVPGKKDVMSQRTIGRPAYFLLLQARHVDVGPLHERRVRQTVKHPVIHAFWKSNLNNKNIYNFSVTISFLLDF